MRLILLFVNRNMGKLFFGHQSLFIYSVGRIRAGCVNRHMSDTVVQSICVISCNDRVVSFKCLVIHEIMNEHQRQCDSKNVMRQ